MRWTEARQGVRVIKFRDVLGRYESCEFNQMDAADLLGVSERTFRRWCQRYEEAGEAGLLDRRFGRASGKRVPVDREAEVEALYRTRYSGFTAKHFHEHLVRDHQFKARWATHLRHKTPGRLICRQSDRHLHSGLQAQNRKATSGQLMCYLNRTS